MLVSMLVLYIGCTEARLLHPQKVHVYIRNDLGGGLKLNVHCKSKDDDLGLKVIDPNGIWEFHFTSSFWGNTQFYCEKSCHGALFFPFKVHVLIRNDVGSTLKLHCKSADDDLGVKVVPPSQTWDFRFRSSFWGNTRFYCSVEWPGAAHNFDAYVEHRDACTTCAWSIEPENPYIPEKINVDIFNDLGQGFNMTIHCKSKNDDLGVHVVPPNGDWQFNFKTSFWGDTQFFCSVEWPGASHYFDAFIEKREFGVCTTCVWSIKPDQPCLVFKDKSVCYPWTS
ncbi:hypothetical protein FNV43_RR02129 [Rhamnella rubrinervis]|uniref:S-protein homolog n=1 Tax=Rhamnella rubrinervis TaxID=2594499 RepID=A0A8K0HQX0_9ROSA|nr:hypothetical protein FNV43_RR02129 [Rhamnella rubrinervis]